MCVAVESSLQSGFLNETHEAWTLHRFARSWVASNMSRPDYAQSSARCRTRWPSAVGRSLENANRRSIQPESSSRSPLNPGQRGPAAGSRASYAIRRLVGLGRSLGRMAPPQEEGRGRAEPPRDRRRIELVLFRRSRAPRRPFGQAAGDRESRAPGRRGRVDAAGTTRSRPFPGGGATALSEELQPLWRDRFARGSLPRLRALARCASPRHRLPALRCAAHGDHRRGADDGRRTRPHAVRCVPQSPSPLRSGGRTLELRATAERPHPSHEVPPGPRGGCRARKAPRPGGERSARCHPAARCGDWSASFAAPTPLPGIQPCRGARRHRPPGAGAPDDPGRAHRPAPHAAPGEGRERGGAPRERRRRVHRSPVAGGPPRGRDGGRRPDDRRHRVRAGRRSSGSGRGAGRGVVLCAYTPFLSWRRAPSSPGSRPRPAAPAGLPRPAGAAAAQKPSHGSRTRRPGFRRETGRCLFSGIFRRSDDGSTSVGGTRHANVGTRRHEQPA